MTIKVREAVSRSQDRPVGLTCGGTRSAKLAVPGPVEQRLLGVLVVPEGDQERLQLPQGSRWKIIHQTVLSGKI